MAEQKANGFQDATISKDATVDADHGRIETRTTTVIHDAAWLQRRHDWPGLRAVAIVDSIRETAEKVERGTRFYITSLNLPAKLHWVMDMTFRDDECRVRTNHAPANFTTIRHLALNLFRRAPGKSSVRSKHKAAAWDDDFLTSLLVA